MDISQLEEMEAEMREPVCRACDAVGMPCGQKDCPFETDVAANAVKPSNV